jgi:hypothetical protein
MSIARRSFLKSATMSTLSAGLALGSAHLIFGQQGKKGENLPDQRIAPVGLKDANGGFAIPFEAQQDALFYFRPSTFTPYVGDIFQVRNSLGETLELKLTRVSEYKMKGATRITTKKTRQPQAFSLTFSASAPLPPFTSIQWISHPALGGFDLFLTSHETEGGTYLFEAIFNHLQ